MCKSVSSVLFDASKKYRSPIIPTEKRVVKYDSDGREIITYVVDDLKSYQRSLGHVSDWSIDSLLKAGINPSFPIHTGLATRIDGASQVSAFADFINSKEGEIFVPEVKESIESNE